MRLAGRRRQPPEGLERERDRGLGRGREPERGRGCGTLRWESTSASRALLQGRGDPSKPGHLTPQNSQHSCLSGEPYSPEISIPQDPYPFSTPAHPRIPPQEFPAPFPEAPLQTSGPSLDTLVSLHPSTALPGPQRCARPHDSRVLAPTWGFLRPGRPPSLGFYSRTRSLIFLSQISLRPRPHGPAPPPSSVPGPPLTHTRSRSTASRAAQAPPSASAVCARSCASPSSRADSVAAASQRARASAGAAGAVRRETEFPTPRAPASKFVVCQLFACFALFKSNLCGVYMAFWCHLHSFS